MGGRVPNSRRNLDIAIDRVLSRDSNPLQIRTVLASTIIGQLLPNGSVKGGSALKLRYGNKVTRFTRDVDAARVDDLEVFLEELDSALQAGWNGFTGRIVRKEPAKPKGIPGEYVMQPFEIKISYNDKSWVTIPLEIGHDEIGDTNNPDYYISHDIVAMFEQLGFPAPKPVALMPIHHQIAQKLHALSTEWSERAHDLIDLQVIAQNEKIDYQRVKNACERLFAFRKQQVWPPVITQGEGWDMLYSNQIDDLEVLQNVEEAIVWVNDLIDRITAG